jgi:two-component sensor histidine kinase
VNVGMPLTHRVDPSADGLRASRQLIIESLRQWSIDDRAANAALDIANELMSNAVQHGHPPIAVRVELDRINGTVTVVVSDGSTAPARPLPYRAGLSERGLGLRIVAQLSTTWGQRQDGEGKSVWATVAASRSRAASWDR